MRQLVLGNLNYSSWSIRPLMAARKVGLPVEEIIVPLDFPETTARLKEISRTPSDASETHLSAERPTPDQRSVPSGFFPSARTSSYDKHSDLGPAEIVFRLA